jgi:hypothetical protein
MKILVFDNYDSFTYNLVHLVEKITHGKVDVFRNDELPMEKAKEYDKIILSPGPGHSFRSRYVIAIDQRICFHQIYTGRVFGAPGNRGGVWRNAALICLLYTMAWQHNFRES